MCLKEWLIDDPALELTGARADGGTGEELVFHRAYHAAPERIMDHWVDPQLRDRWLSLPPKFRAVLLTKADPASYRAQITDGVHSAGLELHLRGEGDFTLLQLTITPYEPLTRALLIDAGHADRWEQTLYALSDELTP
jgi:hypothetical protein